MYKVVYQGQFVDIIASCLNVFRKPKLCFIPR